MLANNFLKKLKATSEFSAGFVENYKEVKENLVKNLLACLKKEEIRESIYYVQNLAYMAALEEFIEGFSNAFLPKMLGNFKQLVFHSTEQNLSIDFENFGAILEAIFSLKERCDVFVNETREFFFALYYINKNCFFIDDYGKYAKEGCRKIFSIVLKKVSMIFHENVKRAFSKQNLQQSNFQVNYLKIDILMRLEEKIAEVLKVLLASTPDLQILSPEQICEFEAINEKIYKSLLSEKSKSRLVVLGLLTPLIKKMAFELKNVSKWNIDEETKVLQRVFAFLALIHCPKDEILATVKNVLEHNFSDLSSLIKFGSASEEKANLKKVANFCWNLYALIFHLLFICFDLLLEKNEIIQTDVLDFEPLKVVSEKIKGQLARRIFESFEIHVKSLSVDKKLGFVSFFAENDKRNIFKDVALNLKDKKFLECQLIAIALTNKINMPLAKELAGNLDSRQAIVDLLNKNGLQKIIKYI